MYVTEENLAQVWQTDIASEQAWFYAKYRQEKFWSEWTKIATAQRIH